MPTLEEKERLQDCMLLVLSAERTLAGLDRRLIPNYEEIEQCFRSADEALQVALRT
jgi:hypothetical protein